MSSSIDPSKPTAGTALTADVRNNFQAAKDEIEENQADIITAQATADAAAAAAASAVSTAMQTIYPIGSLYISTLATNPNVLLGFGTWASFGAGRVLVSQDTGQTEFDTLEETGGEKTHTLTSGEMPSHTHTQNAHTHIQDAHTHVQNSHSHSDYYQVSSSSGAVKKANGGPTDTAVSTGVSEAGASTTTGVQTAVNQNQTATNQNATATNNNTGGGGAHNNLQPYIVVKMWKRTS